MLDMQQEMELNRKNDEEKRKKDFDEMKDYFEAIRLSSQSTQQNIPTSLFPLDESEDHFLKASQAQQNQTPTNQPINSQNPSLTFGSAMSRGHGMKIFMTGESAQSETTGSQGQAEGGRIAAQAVVAAQELTNADKLQQLKLPAVKWMLMEKYPQYKINCIGPPKRLINFMSLHVKEELILDQKRRGSAWSCRNDIDSLMNASDEQVVQFMAQALMPQSAGKYRESLYWFLTKFEPEKGEPRLDVQRYTNRMHAKVDRILNEIEMFDNFFRLNCDSEEERSRLPSLKFGRESDLQAFNFFMEGFYPYSKAFRQLLTEAKLKKCESLADFLGTFRHENNLLSKAFRNVEQMNNRMVPSEKELDFRERMETQKMQAKLREGASEKNRYHSAPTGTSGREQKEEAFRFDKRQDHSGERFRPSIRSFESTAEAQEKQVFTSELNEMVHANTREQERINEEGTSLAAQIQREPMRSPSFPSSRPGASASPVAQRDKPCFNKLNFNACANGSNCAFSHDENVLGREALKILRENKYKESTKAQFKPRSAMIAEDADENDLVDGDGSTY